MKVITEMNDGEYTGEIVDMTTEETADGYPKVTWRIRIVGSGHDGACVGSSPPYLMYFRFNCLRKLQLAHYSAGKV